MAGTIGCGLRTVIFSADKSSVFGGFPVKTPAKMACFPARISRNFGEVSACAKSPSSTTRKPRGIMKPRPISPALQELVGAPEISRTQALKVIWAHIKANNLQELEKQGLNPDQPCTKKGISKINNLASAVMPFVKEGLTVVQENLSQEDDTRSDGRKTIHIQ
ncbi:Upstream activation factor subunit UAF30 [Bienertia sinuspersici]